MTGRDRLLDMCGIVGIYRFTDPQPTDADLLQRMADSIAHRGPDDEGKMVADHAAIANRRLSIIDLENGRQPMTSPDGRYTIVYNGEIFNFDELKQHLEKLHSYPFLTRSDTEVLLAGFVVEGIDFLDRLEGMFAFCVYDSDADDLYLARDAFGIKPLYIQCDSSALFFASEIKALRLAPGARGREIDIGSVHAFLNSGYCLGPRTPLKGIERFPAGEIWKFQRSALVEKQRYSHRVLGYSSRELYTRNVHSVLVEAVERSMVSDVPVGLYLSGGLDSSLIASIVSRELGQKLHSFSIGFPDDHGFNEAPLAEKVAETLGLEHHTYNLKPEDFFDLRELSRQLEEPMMDPSASALGVLSERVSETVKVVLSGEGGDELFGGYHRYFWDPVVQEFEMFPQSVLEFLADCARMFGGRRLNSRFAKLLRTLHLPRSHRYLSWFSPFTTEELGRLVLSTGEADNPALAEMKKAFEEGERIFPGTFSAQCQWVDLRTFLPDDLLVKADKMSMAHSLEVRVPFLQSDVLHAAFSLHRKDRVQWRSTKPILRKLLKRYLPKEIVNRKKQGFEIPLDRWFRGPMKPVLDDLLSQDTVKKRGILNWTEVRKIRDAHLSGKQDRGRALYALAILEAWAQTQIDQ